MVKKGDIVIAGDPDIRDMYICEVLLPAGDFRKNLRVRILEPVRYPIQHAVMHPEVASENPPLPRDAAAMLSFVARVQGYSPGPGGLRLEPMAEYYRRTGSAGYPAALRTALDEYEAKVMAALEYQKNHPAQPWSRTDPKELEIIARHRRGEYEGRRSCLWTA